MNKTAKIHSMESCGAVDGPGLRFIVFFQGCPLRCQYCHNPDTWNYNDGKEIDLKTLFAEIKKYKSFMNFSKGGVTLSGGEPFVQADFILELLKLCKKENIHTAIDTSGNILTDKVKECLKYTDLVLLDIKSFNPKTFEDVTGQNLQNTLDFAQYLAKENIPVWLRFVLVPNLTDNLEDIEKMADYLLDLGNIERVDVLPFHKMGEYKWEQLNYPYKLKETQPPDLELIEKVKAVFTSRGFITK